MKPITKPCQACHRAPATGVWLVTRISFGHERTTAERLCAECGMNLAHELLASLLDQNMPQYDIPPGLKQTATTRLPPKAAISNEDDRDLESLLIEAKRRKHRSQVHQSLRP